MTFPVFNLLIGYETCCINEGTKTINLKFLWPVLTADTLPKLSLLDLKFRIYVLHMPICSIICTICAEDRLYYTRLQLFGS